MSSKESPKRKSDIENDEEDDSKIFPQRLMEILADERNHDAICWLPHGRAFIVRKREKFAELVMPRYFSRKAKYSSFTRKLNRWNFVRVNSGPELGAYYHEFFLRDKPHLAAQMFCKNARTMLAMASSEEGSVNGAKPSPLRSTTLPSAPMPPVAAAPAVAGPVMEGAVPAASFPPVTPALLAALTKNPNSDKSAPLTAPYAPSNLKLLEMHLMQQERANHILLNHAMAMSLKQRQEQQSKIAREQARLMQMRQLMDLRTQQQKNRNPTNPRASAA